MSAVGSESGSEVLVNVVDCRPGDWKDRLRDLNDAWPRGPKAPQLDSGGAGRIYFARWSNQHSEGRVEFFAESGSEDHILFLPLQPWDITCNIGRREVLDRQLHPGDIFVRGPDVSRSRSIYRGGFDVFRLTIPDDVLREGVEAVSGRDLRPKTELFGAQTFQDKTIHHLAMSLFAASRSEVPLSEIFVDTVGLALAAHIAAQYYDGAVPLFSQTGMPLAGWRLKRVTDYIEANLTKDISLGELSAVAGLSRMYFAAQFKAATGASPHSYIVERRVAAARSLLLDPALPIKQIATATGFKSHTQFIRAFRRLVGGPPGEWRDIMLPRGAGHSVEEGSDDESGAPGGEP